MPADSTAAERLPDLLIQRRIAPEEKVKTWLSTAESEGVPLETVLLREKAFTRPQLLQMLENQHFCPSVDVRKRSVDATVLSRVPRSLAEHHHALPLETDGDQLVVAFANPSDRRGADAISVAAHAQVLPRVAIESDLVDAIADQFDALAARDAEVRESSGVIVGNERRADFRVDMDGRSATEAVDALLESAVDTGATDVHFNCAEDALHVRFRIDGVLHSVATLEGSRKAPVIARVKVTSELDIAEHRVPQDGRQKVEVGGHTLDLRVSTLPSQFGENIVLRLLRKDTNLLDIENLRMPPAIRDAFRDVERSPLGFYLVTGPTGSGKTTTLYATLNALDREEQNVITLEDPIEYTLPGITQVQINETAGLTFAGGLRSILRQDPDVVLVGEIRDLETVEIACRASLTGHKVLSTIHANGAVQVLSRLLDMGLPPHLLTATLRGVLAQRLVRAICDACRETYRPNDTELSILGYPKIDELARGTGCRRCAGTGYRGRIGVFEYFQVEENLHRLILDRASPTAIRHAAERNGMISMTEFAKKAAIEGKTTVAEIQRAVFSAESAEQLCGNCARVVSADFAVCPFCQHQLRERCAGCQSPVEQDWEACPNCGREMEREWEKVFCRNCLAPVDAGWKSCNYCGEPIR